MRVAQFSPQVVPQQVRFDLVKRFARLPGFHFEREPSMITTGQMIALGACFTALAFLATRQLFDAAMQFFHLPTHVVRLLSDRRGQGLIWAIGDHPVNVTVCGDQLE